MIGNLSGWHLLIVFATILLLFGAAKLPALAKSVGESARLFKGEMKAMKDDKPTLTTDDDLPAPGEDHGLLNKGDDSARISS